MTWKPFGTQDTRRTQTATTDKHRRAILTGSETSASAIHAAIGTTIRGMAWHSVKSTGRWDEPLRKAQRPQRTKVQLDVSIRVGYLGVHERGCLSATVGHPLRQTCDPPGVLSFLAKIFACYEPSGAVPGPGGLDAGGLLAGLPAAGEYDGALDGGALLAVDVLRVGQPQRLQILADEL